MTKANSRKNTGNKTQRFSSTDEFVSVEALIARLAQMDADDDSEFGGPKELKLERVGTRGLFYTEQRAKSLRELDEIFGG